MLIETLPSQRLLRRSCAEQSKPIAVERQLQIEHDTCQAGLKSNRWQWLLRLTYLTAKPLTHDFRESKRVTGTQSGSRTPRRNFLSIRTTNPEYYDIRVSLLQTAQACQRLPSMETLEELHYLPMGTQYPVTPLLITEHQWHISSMETHRVVNRRGGGRAPSLNSALQEHRYCTW